MVSQTIAQPNLESSYLVAQRKIITCLIQCVVTPSPKKTLIVKPIELIYATFKTLVRPTAYICTIPVWTIPWQKYKPCLMFTHDFIRFYLKTRGAILYKILMWHILMWHALFTLKSFTKNVRQADSIRFRRIWLFGTHPRALATI